MAQVLGETLTLVIEFWDKFRGFNTWVKAEARVIESRVQAVDLAGNRTVNSAKRAAYSDAVIRFTWMDTGETTHSGEIRAPEDSSFFQLIEGDALPIKFNPRIPNEFYVPGLNRDQTASAVKRIVFAGVMFAVVIVVWFGPDLLIAFSRK
jgi:hypothetical protein